jgi:hypothetical protein
MTTINATILSKEQFDERQKELDDLLTSIDVYSNTERASELQEDIQALFDDLAKTLYAIDCGYLDAKLQTFREISRLLKE